MAHAAAWDNIPYYGSSEIVALAVSMLKEHPKLSDDVVKDVVEIIMVHLGAYETIENGFFGAEIPYSAFRNVLLTQQHKIEFTNGVWAQVKISLRPVLAMATNAFVTIESLYEVNKDSLSDEIIQAMWSLRTRQFDFIPWLLFIITGDMQSWMVSSAVLAKAACRESLDTYKRRVLALSQGQ